MRSDAEGSTQSRPNAVRPRVLSRAPPGANFDSPQWGHRTGLPATENARGSLASLKPFTPAFSASKNRLMMCLYAAHRQKFRSGEGAGLHPCDPGARRCLDRVSKAAACSAGEATMTRSDATVRSGPSWPQSDRSAPAGCVFDARHAGTPHAIRLVTTRRPTTDE
jgi:hypothetical protein